ncbi:UvrB/UvrC motif-containing protein [Oscillatoria amoena NRMC-F 0135]|nr:UvrB/UvrC motif-containing protein [Oscillatoria amoena NRMC-F 0135]
MSELESMLEEAEEVEDYERAARIRDEIRKRR